MNPFNTIVFELKDHVARVKLDRPWVHNAINDKMIAELIQVFKGIKNEPLAHIVILASDGPIFCSGADFKWMKDSIAYSFEENLRDAQQLADLLYLIYTLPKPTIARVQGSVFGGGVGLVAVCDYVLAAEDIKFRLSEASIGLSPAVISPYLVRRIGISAFKELALLADAISVQDAFRFGLVNKIVPSNKLDEELQVIIDKLLANGPEALASCKELAYKVPHLSLEDARLFTPKILASLRTGKEAQEGMQAFFEKRRPSWRKK
jgi:methylglutaconyl-CoA hydratase